MEVSMSIFHCHGPFGIPMALSTRRMGFSGNPPILEPAAAGNPPKTSWNLYLSLLNLTYLM